MGSLLQEPNWVGAAQALVDGCLDLPTDEDRVALLVAVCEGLDDELYPALIRVLWMVGQHGDPAAKAAVARALVHAVRTGRLPSGRRCAWGASAPMNLNAAQGRTRNLGPLEYVCAWHAQTDPARALNAVQFDTAARALMDLIASSREARLLYCEKLLADVEDPISGALASYTRAGLRALAVAWSAGASSSDASARFLCAVHKPHAGSLTALTAQSAAVMRASP